MIIVEGPDSQPVPTEKQALVSLVPKSQCKLPVQVFQKLRALFLIKMNQDFRIRVRIEMMTSGYKILSEIGVVKDLAVVDNPDGAIFVMNGLVSAA
jgi:hypothetical protein